MNIFQIADMGDVSLVIRMGGILDREKRTVAITQGNTPIPR